MKTTPHPPGRAPCLILHIERRPADQWLIKQALEQTGLKSEIWHAQSLADCEHTLQEHAIDLVLCDHAHADFNALDVLEKLQAHPAPPPLIVVSAPIGELAVAEALRLGAADYVCKNDLTRLPSAIACAIERQLKPLAVSSQHKEPSFSERRLTEFADYLQMTIEKERAAIAREIHDDIGGSLTAVRHDLFWLQRRFADPDVLAHIQAAVDMLQQALNASQRIMMNLRPAILDQGLVPALEWLCQSFERRTGVMVQATLSLQFDMPKSIELTAYRTVQEALTNISKHAQCSHVTVDVTDAGQCLTLEVADNGQGLTVQDRNKSKSFGLRGLEERARSVGGWLDVSSRPGEGTAIILSVPLLNTET